jgi:hypothetical protein
MISKVHANQIWESSLREVAVVIWRLFSPGLALIIGWSIGAWTSRDELKVSGYVTGLAWCFLLLWIAAILGRLYCFPFNERDDVDALKEYLGWMQTYTAPFIVAVLAFLVTKSVSTSSGR